MRNETTTPMSRMIETGMVDNPWVGLLLRRAEEGDSEPPNQVGMTRDIDNIGEIIFGDALSTKHSSSSQHAVLPQFKDGGAKYVVKMDSMLIHGQKINDSKTRNQGVLLDSGTSNIVVPDSVSLSDWLIGCTKKLTWFKRYKAIMQALSTKDRSGVIVSPKTKGLVLKCGLVGPDEKDEPAMGFVLGGKRFDVPWSDLL